MKFFLFASILIVQSCVKNHKVVNEDIGKQDYLLHISKLNDSIKARRVIWGLTGSHEKKIIFLGDKRSDEVSCSGEEICLMGDSPLFFFSKSDTLFLVSDVLNDSTIHWGKVVLIQKNISTLEKIDLQKKYLELGLKSIGDIPK